MNARVAEGLTASVIQHFPEVLDRYPMCRYASRIRECLMTLGLSKAQVLAWSSELQGMVTQQDLEEAQGNGEGLTREEKLINHQNCIVGEPTAVNRVLTERVSRLEHQDDVFQDVCSDRQKKCAYKHTVNYMKLFVPNGFQLDPSAHDYCDLVLRIGIEAEA
ncbi:unnamed protein product [Phytophthora fragariaefolia]|uniref:Unnamed protein product n=1 Tax=Phytophthora fragariaefolia TaxID=1490495 RepID=A0A9W7D657_9STRA|nr:unnamed protein product [Phytophthora fragariaefolia]